MTTLEKFQERKSQNALHNLLNEAVDNGLTSIAEIKRYAEKEHRQNGYSISIMAKLELYKEYFG